MSKEDYLTEDSINPSNQKFVCLSFFNKYTVKQSVENNNEYRTEDEKIDYDTNDNIFGIKVRGSFATYDDAARHAKKLQTVDKYHNVYVAEVGKWCPFVIDDDEKYVKNTEYANEELNEMMKEYTANQEKAQLYHEFRKNDQVRKNLEENLQIKKESEASVLAELELENNKDKKLQLRGRRDAIEESIEKMQKEIETIEEKQKSLKDKLDLK